MSIKDELDKAGETVKAVSESTGWVHDQRVIDHEKDVIALHEKNMKKHEQILEADTQLDNGLINRLEDDLEKAMIHYDERVIEAAKEKIAKAEQKAAEHQKKMESDKAAVEALENAQKK